MRVCDYCETSQSISSFIPKRATKNQDSIKRYVAKIYAKHPSGVPNDNEDFPKSFQGWIYKEHSKILCIGCCSSASDPGTKREIIKWLESERAVLYAQKSGRDKPTKQVRKSAKPKTKKPKSKKIKHPTKAPSRDDSLRPYLATFEKSVNNVLMSINDLKRNWNLSVITDKNRAKARTYINRAIKSLDKKEKSKFKL